MTKRPYYSDPLYAAIAARDFDIKLHRTHCYRGDGTFGESIEPIPIFIIARDLENQVSCKVKYYLDEDSLHLPTPRVGDYFKIGGMVYLLVDDKDDLGTHTLGISEALYHFNAGSLNISVTGRLGKFFPWPEWE